MHHSLLYQVALTLIPGIGPIKAKNLVAYCGSAEAVFREKPQHLLRIPEIGEVTSRLFPNKEILKEAERELKFIEANHIIPHFFTDKKYPERLRMCEDSPLLIYTKGRMDLQGEKVISIVGTRKATSYGKEFCHELISGIAHLKPVIVSGLAYGIDICAHRNAVASGLQTVACVAHGLEKIYPSLHTSVANEMMNNGGLVSEFVSNTKMTPELFPMRNRVIAGLADCTIVIETDQKGGSMITAHIANSYGREVFALPGRHNDMHSTGCNLLIRKNLAAIITSPSDLIQYMNWDASSPASRQLPLFTDLTETESAIVKILSAKGKTSIDSLSADSGIPFNKLSALLLDLEFRGLVKSLPGKLFDIA